MTLEFNCAYCAHQYNVKDGKSLAECTLSDGKPCLACERQAKLRNRIEETKKLLDKLITEEREARTDISRYHDPLHRLPTEIISYIFRLALPNFRLQKQLFFESCPDEKYSDRGALTLGAVCRTWRRIAWSTPQLWSNMMLTLHHEPTWDNINVVQEWLERSKPLPLNIRLFLLDVNEDDEDSDREEPRRNTFPAFINSFNKHSARWKCLSIQAPSSLSSYFYGNRDGAPLLTTLQLLNFQSSSARFSLKGTMPQPTSIDVARYRQLNDLAISLSNVTRATLDLLSLDDYVELLRNAPRLVKLHLQRIDCQSSFSHSLAATPPIQNRLEDLAVSSAHEYTSVRAAAFYSVIFDSITLPLLKYLDIDGPETSFLNVRQFLTRSSSPLEALTLKVKCAQRDAVNLLYDLPPSLQNIEFNLTNMSGCDLDLNNVFDHLSCAPSSITEGIMPPRPELLPNLEHLTYHFERMHPCRIPWSRLPNLLRPLSGKQRPLEGLVLWPRAYGKVDPLSFFNDKVLPNIDDIRGLLGLLEDGVDLYLPGKVSRDDVLEMLERRSEVQST